MITTSLALPMSGSHPATCTTKSKLVLEQILLDLKLTWKFHSRKSNNVFLYTQTLMIFITSFRSWKSADWYSCTVQSWGQYVRQHLDRTISSLNLRSTVDPWIAQVWTAWVHLHTGFLNIYSRTFASTGFIIHINRTSHLWIQPTMDWRRCFCIPNTSFPTTDRIHCFLFEAVESTDAKGQL